MWPYGYTLADVPSDMAAKDHRAFVAMGKAMAASNGYRPQQASDLYISSGTSRDWLYGRYRVFSFTFEMSPDGAAYPSDESIPNETGRNRAAVLYLIDLADCPYRSIGLTIEACRVSTGSAYPRRSGQAAAAVGANPAATSVPVAPSRARRTHGHDERDPGDVRAVQERREQDVGVLEEQRPLLNGLHEPGDDPDRREGRQPGRRPGAATGLADRDHGEQARRREGRAAARPPSRWPTRPRQRSGATRRRRPRAAGPG